jgi:hypothetical protein
MAERLVEDIFTALDEQTVVVPGTDVAALIVPASPTPLRAVLDQRKLLATRISKVLTSMPGSASGPEPASSSMSATAVRFPTAAHLAAYGGLAPTTRSSGSSIRGEPPSRRGNKQLKRAFFLSAFTALADPVSGPVTTRRSARESTTLKPASASQDAEPTCSSRCSATASP